MAKPILVVNTPKGVEPSRNVQLANAMSERFYDYHVIINPQCDQKDVTFECLNDCKGLPDGGIEKMIADFTALLTTPAATGNE